MQAGDLIFVQEHTLITLGIQVVTEGSFNHVALAVSESEIIEAVPGGVRKVPLQYRRYAVFECVDITKQQIDAAVSYAHRHIGEAYDFLKDAGFAVNFLEELFFKQRSPKKCAENGKIICSSLVDLALRDGGFVIREDRKPGDVTPVSLTYSPKVRFKENHNLWEV